MNNKRLDERQLLIRDRIYKHMFLILICLTFFNANILNLKFIDGYSSGMIILFATLAFGNIEIIIKNVYIDNLKEQSAYIIISILAVIALILDIFYIINGDKIILDSSLSKTGGRLIADILMLIGHSCIPIKIVLNKYIKYAKNEEEDTHE